ncbi:MAG: alpha/beta hydrolase [Cyanobacteria bacterium P01_C01_bin.73]
MNTMQRIGLGIAAAIAPLGFVLGEIKPAAAAETIVLKYGFLTLDFPVEDLSTLAETGQASLPLEFYLNVAGTTPAEFRQVLNRSINVSPVSRQTLREILPDATLLESVPLAEVLLSQLPLEALLERTLLSIFTSALGEAALEQLGDALYSSPGGANVRNLGTAVVTSAVDDGTITLIEVLETYPEDEIVLDGDRILEAYDELSDLLEQFGDRLESSPL